MEIVPQTAVTEDHVNPLSVNADQLEEQVNLAEVNNDESLSKAGDLYKIIDTQLKKGEDARKSLVSPLNNHVKWINAQFKPISDRLTAIKNTLKGKMDGFVAEQRKIAEAKAEEERRKAEEEAMQRASELEQQGDAEAAAAVIDAAADLPTTVPKGEISRGNYGSSTSARVDWKGECVNLQEMCAAIGRGDLPTEFVSVNQAKLNAFATKKKVEKTNWGVRLYKKVSASVR